MLRQMSSTAVEDMLAAALAQRCIIIIPDLVQIPAAQRITIGPVHQLVTSALHLGCSSRVAPLLLSLPGAKCMNSDTAAGLLQVAVSLQDSHTVQQLCILREADRIKPDVLHRLMIMALRPQQSGLIRWLVQLKGAAKMGGKAIAELLKPALLIRDYSAVWQLCTFLPLGHVEPWLAGPLLKQALDSHQPGATQCEWWCSAAVRDRMWLLVSLGMHSSCFCI